MNKNVKAKLKELSKRFTFLERESARIDEEMERVALQMRLLEEGELTD